MPSVPDFSWSILLTAPAFLIFKWLLLIGFGIAVWVYHRSENKKLLAQTGRNHSWNSLRRRGYEVLLAYLALLVVIGSYDIRTAQTRATPAPPMLAAIEPEMDEGSDDNPIDRMLDNVLAQEMQQGKLDAIKEAFEGFFINYWYLYKCGRERPDLGSSLQQALVRSIKQTGVDNVQETVKSMESAAQGSFIELYANSACDEAILTPMEHQLEQYLATPSLMEKIPVSP